MECFSDRKCILHTILFYFCDYSKNRDSAMNAAEKAILGLANK
jgi:hypothetical protein